MLWLEADNAELYLRDTERISPGQRVQIQRLAGGVSNEVLYVAFPDGDAADFVLKQARPQLRVADPWFCGVQRIWREAEVLRVCQEVLARQASSRSQHRRIDIPQILFEDRDNFAFAMTAAPPEHVVWKRQLLAGQFDVEIAEQCGNLLGLLHGNTWQDAGVAERLGDRQIFDELRLDPYYRSVARADRSAAPLMERLVASVLDHPRSLVHADFSPKNLLVYPSGLMMVDFETGHYGDPAFDLGFFLSHLVLKAFYHAPNSEPLLHLTERFWERYRARMAPVVPAGEYAELVARGIQNFAGCAWARLDGKSKVEYLAESGQSAAGSGQQADGDALAAKREAIRKLCRQILVDQPPTWNDVLDACRAHLSR